MASELKGSETCKYIYKGTSENMEKLPLVYLIISFQVGITTTPLTANPGLFTGRARDFFLLRNVQTNFGTHSASYSRGDGGFVLRVKLPQHEASHSPSSNIEFENELICNWALNGVYRKTFASLSSPFHKGGDIYISSKINQGQYY